VEIPYEGTTLAGILRKPAGAERPPVVVMAVGLDSTKEEGDAYETPFLARGMATLIFEGPGQGEAQYDLPIRGDYEVPAKAVIDFVQKRSDLDGDRIGMWGVSLGGYYAPRAAAFDKRIKACIALGGPFNWGAAWDGLPELTREAFRVRSHCRTQEDARKNAETLSLEGLAQEIICPLFIVNGRLDRIVPAKDAERLAREAKGSVTLMMIEDGNHIATNRAYRWRSQSADWMKEQLGEARHPLIPA
jgi:dipeptidyl aminopeptidase/acylaminoacyl peptidase